MTDTKQLKDEELEKVSGGAKYYLYEVSVGDVFLVTDRAAVIVKSNVTANGNNPIVPIVMASIVGNTWQKIGETNSTMNDLNQYTYSQALSGTLNHLL